MPVNKNRLPDSFVHCHREQIRWGDMDAFGHVNNVVYFRYLESARAAYFRDVIGGNLKAKGESVILADQRCTFIKQLVWPGDLDIYTRTARLGGSSFRLAQLICRAGEKEAISTGKGVIVWFDFDEQKSVPIPDKLRKQIIDFERITPEGA